MTAITRRAARVLFGCAERAVTAALYPWCRLRRLLGAGVGVPILMYHQIGRRVPGTASCRDCVTPESFERQIRAIAAAGYRVIGLPALIRALRCGEISGLRRSVVLTFDDGFHGQFLHALPVLRRHGLTATFFLVAGYVGGRTSYRHLALDEAAAQGAPGSPAEWRPLSWPEVREMQLDGIAIGSHTLSHRSLGRLSGHEAELEARRSKDVLEERLGAPVDTFAYPFGSRAYGDFDADLGKMLRDAGYAGACTTVVGRCGAGSDPYALPRIPMEEGDDPFRVRCKLEGAYDWVGGLKSLWQRLAPREDRVDAALPAGADGEIG